MNPRIRKAGSAAYDRIPQPSAVQEAAGICVGLPLLVVVCFVLSALLGS